MNDPIAILGLGRSGISAARAAKAAGAEVIAIDEKGMDDPGITQAAAELSPLGIGIRVGWNRALWETGARTIVISPGVPKNHPLLQEAVRDGLEVISEIELAYRITKAPIVAITGTNGKSTTTVMAWLCAKATGYDAVLCGNIYGSGYREIPLTEAASQSSIVNRQSAIDNAPTLQRPKALIAEISSFQLEWVRDFRPKAATITNITPDHLNRYDGFEDYAKTKQNIFQRMGPDERAAWQYGDTLTEPPSGIKTFTYGQGGDHAWIDEKRLHLLSASTMKDELPFTEPHNYLNAMAAGLLIYGLSDQQANPETILNALKGFKGLSHRMERLGEKNDVELINNSMCTNPAAVIVSSKSLPKRQRLLIGGTNKGLDFREVGEYLKANGHAAYLFGTDGKSIGEQLGRSYPVFNTMAEAFEAAVHDAKPGEAVMLAPGVASTDQFVDFRDRGDAFRQMAKDWLNGNCQGVANENVDQEK